MPSVTKSATLNFNWTAVAGADSYNLKRCAAACSPVTVVATMPSSTYAEVFDATSYFYTVEAVNACGAAP